MRQGAFSNDEFPGGQAERLCPGPVAIRGYAAATGLYLGNERIVFDADLFGEIALRKALAFFVAASATARHLAAIRLLVHPIAFVGSNTCQYR